MLFSTLAMSMQENFERNYIYNNIDKHLIDMGSKKKIGEENKMESTDPYDLDEKSNEFFGKKEFENSAKYFVLSAMNGHEDNINVLYEIDKNARKNLLNTSINEALSYYDNVLLEKIVQKLKNESEKLEKNRKKPIILWESKN